MQSAVFSLGRDQGLTITRVVGYLGCVVTVTDADDTLVPMEHNTTAVIWITICTKFDAFKKKKIHAINCILHLKQKLWELLPI